MERTRWTTHRGRRMVLLDFRDLTDLQPILDEIAAAKRFFARLKPDGSLLTLTDVRGARYNSEVLAALKDLTTHNKPYVRAAAVVATTATHRVAVNTIALFTRRVLRAFGTPEEAMAWLAERGEDELGAA